MTLAGMVGVIGAMGVAPEARAQFSGFSLSAEGWSIVSFVDTGSNFSVVGTYSATFTSSGGNPGGHITTTDPDGGDFTFSAPASFLGNQIGALGGTLNYDIRYLGTVNYQSADVILMGGGLRLLWQSSPVLVPTSSWTAVSVSVAPSGQWHVGTLGGSLATTTDFTTVLGSLTGVFIRGEYAFGSDTTSLDNVRFGLVPEPSSVALLACGIIPVALFLRQRIHPRPGKIGG